MQGFLSELSDLGVMLALICVPLATGAIFIPLGRALAERIRRGDATNELPSSDAGQVADRLDRLEALMASVANETAMLSEQQRLLARALADQGKHSIASASEGRVITPH